MDIGCIPAHITDLDLGCRKFADIHIHTKTWNKTPIFLVVYILKMELWLGIPKLRF